MIPIKPGTARRLSLRRPDRRRACQHPALIDMTGFWDERHTYWCNGCESKIYGERR